MFKFSNVLFDTCLGRVRSNTTPCWPRQESTTTTATTSSSEQRVESTSASRPSASQIQVSLHWRLNMLTEWPLSQIWQDGWAALPDLARCLISQISLGDNVRFLAPASLKFGSSKIRPINLINVNGSWRPRVLVAGVCKRIPTRVVNHMMASWVGGD